MNYTKLIPILIFTSLSIVSCKENIEKEQSNTETKAPKIKKEIKVANVQTASFSVTGMTCAVGCAKTIEEELGSLDGVQEATVDFDKKQAIVIFDKTIQSPEKLTKVVEATGDGKTYKVTNMKS
jgi:mercuric ion binding protein